MSFSVVPSQKARRMQAALRTLGLPHSDAYVGEIMRQYDVNGDGKVDFGEFRRYVAAKEDAIRRAFSALDSDRDGEVTEAEITTAMRWAHADESGYSTHNLTVDRGACMRCGQRPKAAKYHRCDPSSMPAGIVRTAQAFMAHRRVRTLAGINSKRRLHVFRS